MLDDWLSCLLSFKEGKSPYVGLEKRRRPNDGCEKQPVAASVHSGLIEFLGGTGDETFICLLNGFAFERVVADLSCISLAFISYFNGVND